MVRNSATPVATHLQVVLQNLARDEENVELILDACPLEGLVELVEGGSADLRMIAVGVLSRVAELPWYHAAIGEAGGVAALVELACAGDTKDCEAAMCALSKLSESEAGRSLIVAADGVDMLMTWVQNRDQSSDIDSSDDGGKTNLGSATDTTSADGTDVPRELSRLPGDDQEAEVQEVLTHQDQPSGGDQALVTGVGGRIRALVKQLSVGEDVTKDAAVNSICSMACELECCRMIADAGGIPLLVDLVRSGTAKQKVVASLALQRLAHGQGENQLAIARCGGIVALVAFLQDGNEQQKIYAAGALQNIALHPENRIGIAAAGGIPLLVALLREDSDDQKLCASGILINLAQNSANKVAVMEAGGVAPLVSLLRNGTRDIKKYASDLLWVLSDCPPRQIAIAEAGTIPALVRLMDNGWRFDAQRSSGTRGPCCT